MNDIFKQSDMNPTFIFVDGSYYCFYRYYALLTWWKNAHPETNLDDPYENNNFVDKFKKTFVEKLLAIPKKLKIKKPNLVLSKDCKRENIWRIKLFPKYKGSRKVEKRIGPFLKMINNEKLFEKGGIKATLEHPNLEADDCIAISVRYLINKYPDCIIYIITGDRDFLQLCNNNVFVYDLAFKNISDKSSFGNAEYDLEMKIIMGDKSDNIPSAFPKCGVKTSQKCVENPEFFKKKITDNPINNKQYELNRNLIDFNNIPQELVNEFMDTIKK